MKNLKNFKKFNELKKAILANKNVDSEIEKFLLQLNSQKLIEIDTDVLPMIYTIAFFIDLIIDDNINYNDYIAGQF